MTSSKISLPGSSPSGPRCGRDVIRHEDRNGNECDRAHHKLKERIPCSRRRASLLMGDTSRVLRWPYRNGLHWRPVVHWRESATALCAEEARFVARPQIRISQSTVHIRAPEGTQGSLPDDLSLGTVYFTVLPNTFWLEIQCTRGRRLLRNAQLGAEYAGRIQPFEPSRYTCLSACRGSRAGPAFLTKRSLVLCVRNHSRAQLACFSCISCVQIIKRYNLFPRAG